MPKKIPTPADVAAMILADSKEIKTLVVAYETGQGLMQISVGDLGAASGIAQWMNASLLAEMNKRLTMKEVEEG